MSAKRAYGMHQDFYPWSPIVARPVLRWPDNARVALAVIVNLEHSDWEVPDGTPNLASPIRVRSAAQIKFVESDETFIGGKAANRKGKIPPKAIMLSLVERGGRVRSFHLDVPNVTAAALKPIIVANVEPC
jgi:hypothetical protein